MMDAPLSSPSLAHPSQSHSSYFAATSNQPANPTSSGSGMPQTQQSPQSAQAPSTSSFPSQLHQLQQQQQQAQAQRPLPGASATSPFLRDFNLVAEAAKRAQMAVLMRDLEAVGI